MCNGGNQWWRHIVSKVLLPCLGRLLETIKGLLQTTNTIWMVGVMETQWLMKVTIVVFCYDVVLMIIVIKIKSMLYKLLSEL
jgi:hypothetical protein